MISYLNPQTYLIHNLAIRDPYFFHQFLKDFPLKNQKKFEPNPNLIDHFFECLCQSAVKVKDRVSFNHWLDNEAEKFFETSSHIV